MPIMLMVRNIDVARNVTITEVLSKELNENDIKKPTLSFFIFPIAFFRKRGLSYLELNTKKRPLTVTKRARIVILLARPFTDI